MDNEIVKHISTRWIESLAIDELNAEESGVIHFNNHLDPKHELEKSSIQLVEDLRERFEIFITKFNEYRGKNSTSSLIKIFKISNTVNDFMLFRNSLKLVVARRSIDVVSIGFLSNASGLFSPRTVGIQQDSPIHEIKAHVGPFNNIKWYFQGEEIDIDAMTKHYLTEFVKHSAR